MAGLIDGEAYGFPCELIDRIFMGADIYEKYCEQEGIENKYILPPPEQEHSCVFALI